MKMKMLDYPYNRFQPEKGIEKEHTVLIYHGWGSSIHSFTEMAKDIASYGYKTFVPQLIHHETRSPIDNPFQKETIQNYFWKTVFKSIDEFEDFIKTLNLNKEKIILVGSSMGGFIASGINAAHREIAGLVNVNGSGSFVFTEELFRKVDNRDALSDSELDEFKKYDPVRKEGGTTPVLLIHGDSDTIIPIEGQKQFYEYSLQRNQQVNFQIYENVNHQFTVEMVNEVIGWIKQFK